eukprot:scaffold614_cov367-Prasinococcus_capsulatus_cf.AAC.16
MSALVTVQLGQCGNQVGQELFATLAAHVPHPASAACPVSHAKGRTGTNAALGQDTYDAFFRQQETAVSTDAPDSVARAVLVDMEPKAVASVLRRGSRPSSSALGWRFEPDNVFVQQSGSGNNWYDAQPCRQ